MRFAKFFWVGWMLAGAIGGHAETRDSRFPEAAAVLREWIGKQARIRTLRADFVQTRSLATVRLPITKSGSVWFGRGGRFRWQVGDPPESIAIVTPETVILIEPPKRRARILPATEMQGTPAGMPTFPFVQSLEEFHRRFTLLNFRANDDRVAISVAPREQSMAAKVRRVDIVFWRTTGIVERFATAFGDGSQMETQLKNVQVNPAVEDTIFQFDLANFKTDDRRPGRGTRP